MWNMSIPLAVSSLGIFTLTAIVTELELNYGSPLMIFITFWPAGCVKRAGNICLPLTHTEGIPVSVMAIIWHGIVTLQACGINQLGIYSFKQFVNDYDLGKRQFRLILTDYWLRLHLSVFKVSSVKKQTNKEPQLFKTIFYWIIGKVTTHFVYVNVKSYFTLMHIVILSVTSFPSFLALASRGQQHSDCRCRSGTTSYRPSQSVCLILVIRWWRDASFNRALLWAKLYFFFLLLNIIALLLRVHLPRQLKSDRGKDFTSRLTSKA